MKTCNSCLLPETHETIKYNDLGNCNVCEQHDYKKEVIDWGKKKVEFDKLIPHEFVKQIAGKDLELLEKHLKEKTG